MRVSTTRRGSVPAGSSPRAMARSTMASVRANRCAQNAAFIAATSGDAAPADTTLRAMRPPTSDVRLAAGFRVMNAALADEVARRRRPDRGPRSRSAVPARAAR